MTPEQRLRSGQEGRGRAVEEEAAGRVCAAVARPALLLPAQFQRCFGWGQTDDDGIRRTLAEV